MPTLVLIWCSFKNYGTTILTSTFSSLWKSTSSSTYHVLNFQKFTTGAVQVFRIILSPFAYWFARCEERIWKKDNIFTISSFRELKRKKKLKIDSLLISLFFHVFSGGTNYNIDMNNFLWFDSFCFWSFISNQCKFITMPIQFYHIAILKRPLFYISKNVSNHVRALNEGRVNLGPEDESIGPKKPNQLLIDNEIECQLEKKNRIKLYEWNSTDHIWTAKEDALELRGNRMTMRIKEYNNIIFEE